LQLAPKVADYLLQIGVLLREAIDLLLGQLQESIGVLNAFAPELLRASEQVAQKVEPAHRWGSSSRTGEQARTSY
jgi:hypothetical protein